MCVCVIRNTCDTVCSFHAHVLVLLFFFPQSLYIFLSGYRHFFGALRSLVHISPCVRSRAHEAELIVVHESKQRAALAFS